MRSDWQPCPEQFGSLMSWDVVVMNEGRIAQRGTPEAVRQKPAAGFVAEFLALH
jgi:ABC-type Fe3+/spermidine/putrescine transport system ATPase subunit